MKKLLLMLVLCSLTPLTRAEGVEEGFVSLFNGKDLTGWAGDTKKYVVNDGMIVSENKCRNLYTEKAYTNVILRFEFVVPPNGNNGLGVRAPLNKANPYNMMEFQILDNHGSKWKKLKPDQYHGSAYGWVPAKRGFMKPTGEWNSQEVVVEGTKVKITLNGTVILDTDFTKVKLKPGKRHKGRWNAKGHLAFLGHGAGIKFRNIRIKELPAGKPVEVTVADAQKLAQKDAGTDVPVKATAPARADAAQDPTTLNVPPKGFTALFNGNDLTNWKGLLKRPNDNPEKRAKLSPEKLKELQAAADKSMREHWTITDGILHYDGRGNSLCTAKDYGDFEMLVDWKIGPKGDSGIYLRGSPQVQIWDPKKWPVGSGGLYNNKKNPSKPLVKADKPVGEWNRFRIKMVGEKVTVHLNGTLVVDNVTLENYWNRKKPIYPTGQLELQHHKSPLEFKNIFIREITK